MVIVIENLIAVFFIISLYSIVFKDTILFKFGERTFVGIAMGIVITMAVQSIVNKAFIPLTQGSFFVILPIILGVFMLARFSSDYKWLSMYPIVIVTGIGLALKTRTSIEAYIIGQIKPILTNPLMTGDLYTTAGNIFNVIAIITGLTYFLFATETLPSSSRKIVEYSSKIGRYVIIMFLGTSFANTLLGRSSMFLERVLFILQSLGIVA